MNNRNNCRCRHHQRHEVCGVYGMWIHIFRLFVVRHLILFIYFFRSFPFSIYRSPTVIAQTIMMIRISIILLFIHLTF